MAAVLTLEPTVRRSSRPRIARRVPLDTGRPGRPAGAHRQVRPRTARCTRDAAVYRRRRLLAAALGLGLVLTVARAGAALGGVSTTVTSERHPHVESVVVQPGDTLWSIAERIAPDRDPRQVVDALVEARGSSTIVPGETLTWLAP
jgi:hypothetical protein